MHSGDGGGDLGPAGGEISGVGRVQAVAPAAPPADQSVPMLAVALAQHFGLLFKAVFGFAAERRRWIEASPGRGGGLDGIEADAIDRAGSDTQAATGTFDRDDLMQPLGRADDGIHRAGRQAFGAADTPLGIDARGAGGLEPAVVGVERQGFAAEIMGEAADDEGTARRAAIDCGGARGDGRGIGATTVVAATPALVLRQPGVDGLDVGPHFTFMPGVAPASGAIRKTS